VENFSYRGFHWSFGFFGSPICNFERCSVPTELKKKNAMSASVGILIGRKFGLPKVSKKIRSSETILKAFHLTAFSSKSKVSVSAHSAPKLIEIDRNRPAPRATSFVYITHLRDQFRGGPDAVGRGELLISWFSLEFRLVSSIKRIFSPQDNPMDGGGLWVWGMFDGVCPYGQLPALPCCPAPMHILTALLCVQRA
jgi:hypothetical protein